MLFLIHVLFLMLSAFILAEQQEKKLVETIPVVFSIFVLLLYFLAFFNRMWLIDYVSLAGILAGEYFLCKNKQGRRFAHQLLEPSFLIFAAVTVVGMIAVSARGVAAFDDFNFWAVDIRSIYSLQGYAAKGFNCAAAYGDYPPAMQLVAAWLMHGLGGFREGYMACGYFLIMQVYMATLLVRVPYRVDVCLGAFVWMFVLFTFGPDILESTTGYAPDPLMGIIYGFVLVLIFSRKKVSTSFDYFNIAAVMSVLVLTKSVGVQWAIFAVLFMASQTFFQKRTLRPRNIFWMLLPVCSWFSWHLFCKIFERATYLLSDMQAATESDFFAIFKSDLFEAYGKHIFLSFIEGLFCKFQSGIFFNIGFCIASLFVAFIVAVALLRKFKLIDTKEFQWLLMFTVLSGILEAGILLFSMETMFLAEFGPNPNLGEMTLFKRYGAPYTIGTTMLLLYILFDRLNEICLSEKTDWGKRVICRVWLAVIVASIAVAPVGTIWQRYISYREIPWLLERETVERYPDNPAAWKVLATIDMAREAGDQKILLITDGNVSFDLLGIQYYAAPIAVVMENGGNGRAAEWNQFLQYHGCTAVCFVGDDTDGTFLGDIRTAEGEPAVPYTIYYCR